MTARRTRLTGIGGATIAFVCALLWAMQPAVAGERTFAIGLDAPLSGIDGASGIPVRNGALLAIEDANRAGFPGGYRAVLKDLDDTVQGKHSPAQGAQNFKSFIDDPSVLAVVGPMNSNVAEAQIPLANESSLALISMAATSVSLTKGDLARKFRAANPGSVYFFRVCASDDRQGAVDANFAKSRGWKRAFVIDDNESYGRGLADVFASEFVRGGGALLGREHLVPFALDFKPLLTKVAALKPDVVFFGGITSTGGAVLRKQMADTGLGGLPYLGGDGLESPDFIPLAGAAAGGTYFTIVGPDVNRLPAAKAFVAAYRKRFGADPGAYSAEGYAAAAVALQAVRRNLIVRPGEFPVRASVASAAAAFEVPTPIGTVAFDSAGDLKRPIVSVYRVAGGRERFVTQIAAP